MLDPGARASLEARLAAYDRATTNQIAIALFPDLGGVPVNDFAVRLEEAWKVGRRGRDNGLLLLVALTERQIRIEVGYGLEGRVTDADAGRIIRNDLAPAFRDGRYADGLSAAVDSLTALIGPGTVTGSAAPGTAAGRPVSGAGRPQSGGGSGLAVLFFLAFVALASFAARRSARRCPRCGAAMRLTAQTGGAVAGAGAVEAWTCSRCGYKDKRLVQRSGVMPVPYFAGGGWGSGGFGGGGFGGFGGGASGGGGATGGW